MSKEIEIVISLKQALEPSPAHNRKTLPFFVYACCGAVLDYVRFPEAIGLLTGPRGHLQLAWHSISCSALREDDGDDEAIQGQSLSEDHHENERNQDISLSVAANTSVTDNTDAETGSEVR